MCIYGVESFERLDINDWGDPIQNKNNCCKILISLNTNIILPAQIAVSFVIRFVRNIDSNIKNILKSLKVWFFNKNLMREFLFKLSCAPIKKI